MTPVLPWPCQERKRYPICVGAGYATQVVRDIKNGKTHCLVWAAGGVGWEKPSVGWEKPSGARGRLFTSIRSRTTSSTALLTQQEVVRAYAKAEQRSRGGLARPPLVVVVMPHGARRTAADAASSRPW